MSCDNDAVMLLSLNGTKCKHCIMAWLGITHNKQDTSIVALITLLWIIHPVIQSQQQTLEECFYKYNICLDSNSHFFTFQLASILDQV